MNRAWIIGRPIVYLIVDVWSTAIVGFHVCLSGPSWETARISMFSTAAPEAMIAELWGIQSEMWSLDPCPGLPYALMCDRGEYLSAGARDTARDIGVNFAYAPSYRPDMKGMVEVLHRIAKDQQYSFVPGAMDARRKELELRVRKETSAFTLPEYVNYLVWRISLYNLHAERTHRLDAAMISAGVHPSPAGLWRFGFEVGIGYRKQLPVEKLIVNLLPEHSGSVRRDGIFLDKLEYRSELATSEQWTTLAKHAGRMEIPLHYFPGAMRKVWTPHPHGTGLLELLLSDQALAPGNLSLDECRDAWEFHSLTNAVREHDTVQATFRALEKVQNQVKRAKRMTRAAEEAYTGPKPTITEARQIENKSHVDDLLRRSPPQAESEVTPSPSLLAGDAMVQRNLQYAGLMDQILGGDHP